MGLLVPSAALADATVRVRVTDAAGRPVEANVRAVSGSTQRSCITAAGGCALDLSAGAWTVSVAPARGVAPASRVVDVPAAGAISLVFVVPAGSSGGVAGERPSDPTPSAASTVRVAPGVVAAHASGGGAPSPGTGAPSPGTAATAGGSASSTAPSSSGVPASRVAVATRSQTTGTSGTSPSTSAATGSTRNLGVGRTPVASGRVVDAAGRPVDATLSIFGPGGLVGTATTTAGRFVLYDLPAATYSVTIRTARGASATGTIVVGEAAASVTFRVP
ncbi:MAG: carboxypeptidase-like regulatory domain-containing protein [Myxococcota bacterium]|nr:carboxypeptidase-like regulatory domain-containing protein [Myxococcota bacterium]MDW8361535.1 carboxypeptidase-like regulatory domain-containing protein [Myxococcales bacterium]